MKIVEPKLRSVLAVDDKPEQLHLLMQILDAHSFLINPAVSAAAALRFLESCETLPDIILLDVDMPGTNGFQLCAQLKADEKTRDIPVIFISVGDQIVDKATAFAHGGVDYIVKPFQPEEVLLRVNAHLQNRDKQLQLERRLARQSDTVWQVNARLKKEIELREQAEQRLYEIARASNDPSQTLAEQRESDIAISESTAATDFSARELQILRLLNSGLGNREIAAIVFLSEVTVKWHLRNIFLKLDVNNRSKAIIEARKRRLV